VSGPNGIKFGPRRIAVGPDDNLWFTEIGGDRIGRVPAAGRITEFRKGIARGAAPNGITAGPEDNLWFTEAGRARVAKAVPST
jgi:virginiamycin B lyase